LIERYIIIPLPANYHATLMNTILKKSWPHLTALLSFVILSLLYMNPVFQGKILNQSDQVNWAGMAQEVLDHREVYNEDPLWTNAMFGGMPATQISMHYPGQLLNNVQHITTLGIPRPAEMLFLYMIGFYILLMCLRINPWIALGGSVFFTLTSYTVLIIIAGHNAKAYAIAYMAPVIGTFILTYRRKMWLGAALSALFMGLELNTNHPQISYYLLIILIALGVVEMYTAIKKKDLIPFAKKTGLLIAAYCMGFLMTCGNLFSTMDYTESTIRGKSDLTLRPDSSSAINNQTSGLDIDYATQWSYGKGESFSFIIPNAKGGETAAIGNGDYAESLSNLPVSQQNYVAQNNQYWGDQTFVLGPVYLGVIVFLLFLLGLYYVKDKMKWALLAACILALFLSWGRNFMPLTEFFLHYVPYYNKFRAVSMTLVILEICVPILAVLFLSELLKNKEGIKKNAKPLYIISGGMVLMLLLFAITPSTFFDFLSANETASFSAQLDQNANNSRAVKSISAQMAALEGFRMDIFTQDVVNGLLLIVLGCLAPIFLFLFGAKDNKTTTIVVFAWICVFAIADLWIVDKRYLHNKGIGSGESKQYEQWVNKINKKYPLLATNADREIMKIESDQNPELQKKITAAGKKAQASFPKKSKMKKSTRQKIVDRATFNVLNRNTNYRVFDQSGGFKSSRASYFHKSIGGYHGAKLRRFQGLMDFHLVRGNIAVYNMLNTKYFIGPTETGEMGLSINPGAMGNAWCVNNINWVKTADEEIFSLNTINPLTTVTLNEKFKGDVKSESFGTDAGNISMTNYKANEIRYDFSANSDQMVVFSEIYYEDGWQATIDGKEAKILQGNFALRAMEVPSGNHEIIFSYSDDRIDTYGLIMLISSILVFLGIALAVYSEFKNAQVEDIKITKA